LDAEATPSSYDEYLDGDFLLLGPDEVARRVRAAGIQAATQAATSATAGIEFRNKLTADIANALRDQCSSVVAEMRPAFAEAMTVVRAAAKAGITSTSDPAAIVESDTTAGLTAYRALPAAVRTLNTIGRLRDQFTPLCNVGPGNYPAAAFIGKGATLLDLEGAHNLDDTTAMVTEQRWHGPVHIQRPVIRTGGRWLALVVAGYTVRLNTGDEADQVVATAQAEGR
jgi:hypothetical protein